MRKNALQWGMDARLRLKMQAGCGIIFWSAFLTFPYRGPARYWVGAALRGSSQARSNRLLVVHHGLRLGRATLKAVTQVDAPPERGNAARHNARLTVAKWTMQACGPMWVRFPPVPLSTHPNWNPGSSRRSSTHRCRGDGASNGQGTGGGVAWSCANSLRKCGRWLREAV